MNELFILALPLSIIPLLLLIWLTNASANCFRELRSLFFELRMHYDKLKKEVRE